jgi:hypothetical protein
MALFPENANIPHVVVDWSAIFGFEVVAEGVEFMTPSPFRRGPRHWHNTLICALLLINRCR